jgi:hypothetical protein
LNEELSLTDFIPPTRKHWYRLLMPKKQRRESDESDESNQDSDDENETSRSIFAYQENQQELCSETCSDELCANEPCSDETCSNELRSNEPLTLILLLKRTTICQYSKTKGNTSQGAQNIRARL